MWLGSSGVGGALRWGAVRNGHVIAMMRPPHTVSERRCGQRRWVPVCVVACAVLALPWRSEARAAHPIALPAVDPLPVPEPLPSPAQQSGPSAPTTASEPAADSGWEWPTWPDWTGPKIDWISFSWDWPGQKQGGGGSTTYIFAEMVAFQRDNQSSDIPLVTDTLTGNTLISVGDLNAPFAYGARAFVGTRGCDGWGYEAGYLGVYGMATSRSATGFENLRLDGPLAGLAPLPFEAADRAEATYSSIFQSGEINIFKSCCQTGFKSCCQTGRCGADACDASACGETWGGCCIDWLGGFRYVNLTEQAGLTFTCCTTEPVGPFTSSYNVQTSNNLFGGQFGGRASRTWRNWAVEGWAKAGVFANVQHQSQDPILDPLNPGVPARTARSASGVEPAMLADLNLSVVYRINRVFGLRVGYNALLVGNVALAPNQWDLGANDNSGTGLAGNGGLFLNGVNFGIDACW